MLRALCTATLILALAASANAAPTATPIPRLVTANGKTLLEVSGRPFLMRAGELGNSSAATAAWVKPILAKLPALGLNTVLVPVSWEQFEPVEGKFEPALLGELLLEARRNKLRVVLLWFGSWKNGMSSYVPAWIKRDQHRFPRAELGGHGVEALSAFSDANRDADARAFATLMRELRRLDERERTVVMVQVENEVAMIDSAMDRSAAATTAFRGPVPAEFTRYLTAHAAGLAPELAKAWRAQGSRTTGDWETMFGKGVATEELFTAWHLARYTEAVARAGKAVYPLPMFVNAALSKPGLAPGQYPSGGPLPWVFDAWRAAAPTIDVLAPDIYAPTFAPWCERYRHLGNPLFMNPLFVPEARNGDEVGVHALYTFGQGGLGFSPFAVESMSAAAGASLTRAYEIVTGAAPLLQDATITSAGVLLDKDTPPVKLPLGAFTLTVAHDYTFPWAGPGKNDPTWPRAGGFVIALPDGDYVVAGNGIIVTFAPSGAGEPIAGIEAIDEGRIENGRFVVTRRLNGDETHQGRHLRLPLGAFGVQRVRLYRYR